MTVVRGLDAILSNGTNPTPKQLEWIREHLGEDELDRIIIQNLTKDQVAGIIGNKIEEINRTKQYTHRPYRHRRDDCIPSWENSWGDDWG